MSDLMDYCGRLDAWVTQVEKTTLKQVRQEVESLFKFILETTPQASGRAVANWKIGINAPDTSWDPNVGDSESMGTTKGGALYTQKFQFRQKGDPHWIQYALLEEGYKYSVGSSANSPNRIKLGDTIYISNSVQGDDGEYLAALQDPGHWSDVLREVNQPYVTLAEALLIHSWDAFADGGSNHLDKFV